jgi:HK97 family phage major capsid protein
METKEITDALGELRNVWETELKPRVEQMETEQKATGEARAETKESLDAVQDRLDQLETKLEKAHLDTPSNRARRAAGIDKAYAKMGWTEEHEDAFWDALRDKGDMESKALVIRDETLGGVLAPPEFVAEVIKGIVQYSPIRDIASVRQTTRTSVQFPKRTGVLAAAWVAEIASRAETTGQTYGLEEIPTHELYARVLLSNWDLEDPVVDLEADVRASMEEQFGVAEGTAFTVGTGVGKPEGLLANITGLGSADVEQVLNGGASFTSPDGLIKLAFQLKEQYWPNARYLLNRFTLRDVRLLKDTTNNYLWQPGVLGESVKLGLPPTINGYPYTIATDVPVAASNALTVAFGDFRKGYLIVDRVQVSVLRDPYSQASGGQVVVHARKRVGGQVVLPEALKILKMA